MQRYFSTFALAGQQRHQFRGRSPGFGTSEVSGILDGPRGFVLLDVSPYGSSRNVRYQLRGFRLHDRTKTRPSTTTTQMPIKRCGCWPARMPKILLLWIAATMSAVKRRGVAFMRIQCLESRSPSRFWQSGRWSHAALQHARGLSAAFPFSRPISRYPGSGEPRPVERRDRRCGRPPGAARASRSGRYRAESVRRDRPRHLQRAASAPRGRGGSW
jgi:hypothetical protein